MSWYRETPTQRLAFQVTVAGAIAFVAYGTFRAWTDYIDPSAPSRDEAAVLSTPLIAGNPVVFFDLELDGKPMGRVTFQLRKVSPEPETRRRRRAPSAAPQCARASLGHQGGGRGRRGGMTGIWRCKTPHSGVEGACDAGNLNLDASACQAVPCGC